MSIKMKKKKVRKTKQPASTTKDATIELQDTEGIYRTLVENISLGITLIDTNYRIIMTNAGQGRILKKAQNKFVGKYCFKEFEKRDAVCSHCPGTRAMATGRPADVETEGVRDDGSRVPARVHAFPVYEADGTAKGFIEVIEDISERKQTEEALKESQEMYKTLFEGTSEGILVADIETRQFKYANPAVCKMLGYTKEELKQLGVPGIHPKEELRKVISEFEAQARGEKSLAEAIPCLRKDGTVIYADINTASLPIDGVRCNVGFFTDITERKHTEEELGKARDQLEIRVQQRTADLGKAIEKLRNEVGERKKAEEKLLTYQKQLRSSASELSLAEERLRRKIATDVHDHLGQNLAISKLKIESLAQSATSPQLIEALKEIRDLIAQAVESTRSLTFELSSPILYELGFGPAVEWLLRQTRQQHGLSTEFTDDEHPKPLDDDVRVLLFQAVRELLVNVVKHAKASSVKVSTQKVNDQIRVNVEDDGVGFDVAQLYSQDRMTDGFGLFNMRERLNHIGGHFDIVSRAGKGTRITLVVPITHEKEKSKEKRK
jgi:PAS domain S-box-containing protein